MSEDAGAHHIELRNHAEHVESDSKGNEIIPELKNLIKRLCTSAKGQDSYGSAE